MIRIINKDKTNKIAINAVISLLAFNCSCIAKVVKGLKTVSFIFFCSLVKPVKLEIIRIKTTKIPIKAHSFLFLDFLLFNIFKNLIPIKISKIIRIIKIT